MAVDPNLIVGSFEVVLSAIGLQLSNRRLNENQVTPTRDAARQLLQQFQDVVQVSADIVPIKELHQAAHDASEQSHLARSTVYRAFARGQVASYKETWRNFRNYSALPKVLEKVDSIQTEDVKLAVQGLASWVERADFIIDAGDPDDAGELDDVLAKIQNSLASTVRAADHEIQRALDILRSCGAGLIIISETLPEFGI